MRNADSGVWLGSDMSDDSIDSVLSSKQRMAAMVVEDEAGPANATLKPRAPTAESLAARAINHCLETGQESVDLTDLKLTNLSNETLKPLHQLIRHSHTNLTQPPSEDEFSPLTPSIQLFMSGNLLPSLPPELFKLINITVLSLRNNELNDIPPSIADLASLKELNIAQNNIKWLPWEMLDIMHCRGTHKQITVRPNPLVDPIEHFTSTSPLSRLKVTNSEYNEHLGRWGETSGAFFEKMKQWYSEEDVPWSMRHELELRLKLGRLKRTNYLQEASGAGIELQLCREQLIYLASSAVRFFDVDGSLCRDIVSLKAMDEKDQFAAVVDPLINRPTSLDTSSCPSLFESALRSIQSNFALQDPNDFPEDLPRTVSAALREAAKGAAYGNEKCAVCGQAFIIARAEWIEFWFNGFPAQGSLTPETVVPFLRRACSWRCAQPNELGAVRF